ncbi:MAG: hypothetical protein ACOH1I_00605 [Gallionellaceae bacterium]
MYRHPSRPYLWCQFKIASFVEVYGTADAQAKFVFDLVSASSRVLNLDRFDLAWFC